MRVCISKLTGKMIEAQSGDDPKKLEALIRNAKSAGLREEDVEVKIVTQEEFDSMRSAEQAARAPVTVDQKLALIGLSLSELRDALEQKP